MRGQKHPAPSITRGTAEIRWTETSVSGESPIPTDQSRQRSLNEAYKRDGSFKPSRMSRSSDRYRRRPALSRKGKRSIKGQFAQPGPIRFAGRSDPMFRRRCTQVEVTSPDRRSVSSNGYRRSPNCRSAYRVLRQFPIISISDELDRQHDRFVQTFRNSHPITFHE